MSTSSPASTLAATCLVLGCVACGPSTAAVPRVRPPLDVDQTHDGVTLNPYHAVVRRKVLRAFRGLSRHDPGPSLSLMADDVHYTFEGAHALGGTRVTRDGVATWFARLLRLLPGQFVIHEITVKGWPSRTRVVTRFDHWIEPPDAPAYWAAGVQVVRLRWGKATSIHTYVDTARLERTLASMAAAGDPEAVAPPIER